MNYHKYFNSVYLKENPLCGIDTYKDELNLSTGACTRQIKKLVLKGNESWITYNNNYFSPIIDANSKQDYRCICTHLTSSQTSGIYIDSGGSRLKVFAASVADVATSVNEWKTYLADQYANGTPVTIWYALATQTTESVTVPTGLSGTVYGSLTQAETPTPSAPVYPTENDAEAWYDIGYHKRVSSAWTDVTNVYERDNGAWTNS